MSRKKKGLLELEALAKRIVPVISANWNLASQTLTVIGDTPDEDVKISTNGATGRMEVTNGMTVVPIGGTGVNEPDPFPNQVKNLAVSLGAGNDKLFIDDLTFAEGFKDTLDGQNGNDSILATNYNDFIRGGADNDRLSGFSGHDTIDGEGGMDKLFGMDGSDSLVGGDMNDTLSGTGGGIDNDTLRGGGGNDQVFGGNGNDSLFGDGGNDELFGDWGSDSISGGDDHDFLSAGGVPGLGDGSQDFGWGNAGIDSYDQTWDFLLQGDFDIFIQD